jgi:methylmalonyl-CoA/ethylmalonyl-CoA epimerase
VNKETWVLKKIHHVAVVVKSADEALTFYRDRLGLHVTKDAVVEDQGIRGVLLEAGDGEIELIEPVREGTGVARFLESKGEGLHHVCFESDDVGAELRAAAGKGITLIDQAPRRGLAGMIGFLHPRATRGVLVEYATPVEGEAAHAGGGAGPVTDLDHVVVAVSDLAAGVKTWQDNFGLLLGSEMALPALGVKAAILPIGGATIELCTPLGEEGPFATFLKDRGEGLYLVSLRVGSIDAAVSTLRGKGVRVTDPTGGVEGARLAFIGPRSAHGVTVQLIERSGS